MPRSRAVPKSHLGISQPTKLKTLGLEFVGPFKRVLTYFIFDFVLHQFQMINGMIAYVQQLVGSVMLCGN